jgi:hypothetical protein
LGAVSPKLMEIYRNGDLALDQLMAFAITEDHARQEAAYERLSHNRDASTIRRMLTKANVAATDRGAIFVGAEAYTEVGGTPSMRTAELDRTVTPGVRVWMRRTRTATVTSRCRTS